MKEKKTRTEAIAKEFIARFLRDKKFLSTFSSHIVLFDFDSIMPGLNWIIEQGIQFYNNYNDIPNEDFLISSVSRSNFSDERKEILKRVINELFRIDLAKTTYRVDEFRDEMATLFLKSAISDIGRILSSGKIHEAIKEINMALSRVSSLYRTDIEVQDYGASWREREKRREELIRNERFLKTGIKDLDDQVRMTYRTVTAFLAPFKRYKSITLTNIGWAAMIQKMNVLHINYEGRQTMIEARYDTRFSDIDFEKILFMRRTEEEQERFERIMEMVNQWKNRLFLVRGVPYVTGVRQIKDLIDSLEQAHGIYIDVVIIDYFQIMGVEGFNIADEEDWKYQHQIAWSLVDLANYGEKGRIVVGAIQTKMYAVTAESLRADHSGRSIAYPQVVDNIIAINQTSDEREEGIIRFSPLILRDGEIKKAHCKVESMLWRMKIAKEMDSLLDELI